MSDPRLHAALLLVALMTAGCAGRTGEPGPGRAARPVHDAPVIEPANEPATPAPAGYEISSSDGTYRIVFRPPPSDLPLNELFTIDASVLDGPSGAPIAAGIDLAVDAAMPAHRHGMNTRPRVDRNPDGSFTARGMLLHMPGDWELYFDVTKDGLTERAQTAVSLD